MNRDFRPKVKAIILAVPAYVARAVWVVVALICLRVLIFWPVGYGESSLINRLIAHWPLTMLISLVGLMIAGYFGAGLGLPTLFRDDPDVKQRIFGRSFGAGFGSSLLVVVVLVVIFFCDLIAIQERITFYEDQVTDSPEDVDNVAPVKPRKAPDRIKQRNLRDLYEKFDDVRFKANLAWISLGAGTLRNQYRTLDRHIVNAEQEVIDLAALANPSEATSQPRTNRGSQIRLLARLSEIYKDILAIERTIDALKALRDPVRLETLREIELDIWAIYRAIYINEFINYSIVGSISIIFLLMGCLGITTAELAKRRLSSRSSLVAFRELAGYILGCLGLMGVAIIAMIILVLIDFDILTDIVAKFGLHQMGWVSHGLNEITRFQHIEGAISVFFFLAGLLGVFAIVLNRFRVSAGLGICMLFSVIALLYLFLNMIHPGSQLLVVGGVAVALIWINSSPFKYRFPGMDAYYASPIDLHSEDEGIDLEGAKERSGPLDESGRSLLLDDREALKAWARRFDRGRLAGKPKLVLVTATGAAYRASFWTTVVLERLEKDIPGFLNQVRLITGASGGMVGAAYVVAMLEEPTAGVGRSPNVEATDRLKADSNGDSLSPVIRKLIDGDLPRALLPWSQAEDRGRTLEDQWKRLDGVTFADLRQGEKEGWRPSLVLSPMIVETGRRLLFSNLDLYGLTDIQARNRSSVSIDDHDRGPLPAEGGHRRLSRSAVEFFRAFPKVYHEFQVKVAVRMNASFPYISPAVSLPVVPSRRVVDAGYYDNYGVNLAASWAFENRKWIREHTSGLALVQIRAYESEAIRKRLWVEPRTSGKVGKPGRIARFQAWVERGLNYGIHALTTPLKSLASARQWSMSYRNDEQVSLLGQEFNTRYELGEGDDWACVDRTQHRGQNGWFDTFVFENPLSFGMNWLMTGGEIEEMKKCFDPTEGSAANARLSQRNLDQLERLQAWWGDRHDATEVEATDSSDDPIDDSGPTPPAVPCVEPMLAEGRVAL